MNWCSFQLITSCLSSTCYMMAMIEWSILTSSYLFNRLGHYYGATEASMIYSWCKSCPVLLWIYYHYRIVHSIIKGSGFLCIGQSTIRCIDLEQIITNNEELQLIHLQFKTDDCNQWHWTFCDNIVNFIVCHKDSPHSRYDRHYFSPEMCSSLSGISSHVTFIICYHIFIDYSWSLITVSLLIRF